MKKLFVLFMVLTMTVLAGCQGEPADKTEAGDDKTKTESFTFTDDLGREVTVNNPQRVVALLGSFAEMWQLAGGDVVATADDAWDDLGLTLAEDTVNIGNTKSVSVEKIFAADPDFIIASSNTRINMELLDTFESTGIPTAYFEVSGFDDYLRVLKTMSDITGREDLYQKNGLGIQQQIEDVIAASKERLEGKEAPTVLYLRVSASALYAKNSKDSVLGEMLAALGCHNIADDDDSMLENVSIEHVLKVDPDYVFTVQLGSDTEGTKQHIETLFAEGTLWSTLSAVKEGRWHHLDKRLYNLKPNALWGDAYEGLEAILAAE